MKIVYGLVILLGLVSTVQARPPAIAPNPDNTTIKFLALEHWYNNGGYLRLRAEFDQPRLDRINFMITEETRRNPKIRNRNPGDLHLHVLTENQIEIDRIVSLYTPGYLEALRIELNRIYEPSYHHEMRVYIEKRIGWPLESDSRHFLVRP